MNNKIDIWKQHFQVSITYNFRHFPKIIKPRFLDFAKHSNAQKDTHMDKKTFSYQYH